MCEICIMSNSIYIKHKTSEKIIIYTIEAFQETCCENKGKTIRL